MEWVLDCSLALAWALPDESSPKAAGFLESLNPDDRFWVPALWWYELSNGLIVAQRRRRLTEAERMQLTQLYDALPIQTDVNLNPDTAWRFQTIAKEEGLSAYDAAYLELAQRRGLGLATLDRALILAARKAGVALARL
jgi:predicted nucleic acid-binding protein